MANINGLPVFEALVDSEDTGMLRISLVDDPAVMSDFLAFAGEQRKVQRYEIADEDRHLVFGVVMRADFPIYRYDEGYGGYYIIYKAETIRRMAQKYLAEGRQNNVDLMHDGNEVEGVEMVQAFLKDTAKGVEPAGFDDIADGSLFAEFHIEDEDIWAQVKDGTFKGFSLEGIFDLEPETNEGWINEVVEEVGGLFEKYIPKLKKMNNKIAKIKAALAKALAVAFGQVTTDKGILEWDGEEDLKIGDEVYMTAEDGTRTAAEDGDYTIDDGKVIRVADGKVADIIDPEAEVAPETEEVETEAAEEEVENPDTPGEESAPDAIEALRKEVNELFARVDAFETRINELTEEVARLKEAPAAEPAHDEFKRAFKPETTDKKVANAVSIAGARR